MRWIVTRGALKRLGVAGIVLVIAVAGGWWSMIRMPGRSWKGPLPQLTESQAALRQELQRYVEMLAGDIGEHNVFRASRLTAAEQFIEAALVDAGYTVQRHPFEVQGVTCVNLSAEIRGAERPREIVIVGGHYDTVSDCPGANDNGSGVAATLALAGALRGHEPARTIRFVAFVNEEPPFFQTPQMGSLIYARACRDKDENVVAMLSLETIGFYSDTKGSQKYPVPFGLFYPSRGDFIAFVGNYGSRRLVREVVGSFRRRAKFPSQGGALPGAVPGIGWSDHWSFWQAGYPALMVTDTAPFRYPHYHKPTDTPDKLDYERMARVVDGLRGVVEELAE